MNRTTLMTGVSSFALNTPQLPPSPVLHYINGVPYVLTPYDKNKDRHVAHTIITMNGRRYVALRPEQ